MKTLAKIRREIRAAWIERLFSTEPANRPRAEAAAAAVYTALRLPAPRHFLWFDGPCAAAWAAALLLAPEDEHWRKKLRQAERAAALRSTVERIGEHLRQVLPEPAGSSLKSHLDPKRLFRDRLSLYPDIQTLWRRAAFTDEDDLHRAERHFRGTLSGQVSTLPVGHLLDNDSGIPMSMIAADEAQAAGRRVPPLLAAFWEMARAAGPWWGFEHAVILTDRPAEIHCSDRLLLRRTDGPAAVYRDGWSVYAIDGHAVEPPAPR